VNESVYQQSRPKQPSNSAVRGDLRTRRQTRRPAFTIVELIVVLLIMSIVAAVAAPSFYRSLQYHQLESAARRVKHDLEYLQAAARTRSTTLECEFDGFTYTMGGAAIDDLDNSGDYSVDLAAPPYELQSVVLDLDGESSIVFDGYGEAAHDATITLGVGDKTRTVQVVAASGAIVSSADHN